MSRTGVPPAGTIFWWTLCCCPAVASEPPCFAADAWPEADALFLGDDQWIGADGASSVDLGGGRTLWMFADSWVDVAGDGSRRSATLIRNSIAIQSGYDPVSADIDFYWGVGKEGEPAAFFPGSNDEWFWPGHGIRIDDSVVVFLNRMRSSDTGLGFESAGWNPALIHNPGDHPHQWRVQVFDVPTERLGITPGFAGATRWQDFVYALGSADPVKTHPVYAVRWPVDDVKQGRFDNPEWWTGPDTRWVSGANVVPTMLFDDGQSELGIAHDDVLDLFLVVQTIGFGAADIGLRSSAAIGGKWTSPLPVFRPKEFDRPNIMIYAAKLHPQLSGADMVLTYATNTFEFAEHFSDPGIYYPRFVRLTRCETGLPAAR
jgi:hypothetical protein